MKALNTTTTTGTTIEQKAIELFARWSMFMHVDDYAQANKIYPIITGLCTAGKINFADVVKQGEALFAITLFENNML